MEPAKNLRVSKFKSLVIPIFVLIIAIVLSTTSSYFVYENTNKQSELKFDQSSHDIQNLIKSRIDVYTNVLYDTQAFFASSDFVSRLEYHNYFKQIDLFSRYPGINAISFTQKIFDKDKVSFEKSVQVDKSITSSGYPNFKIKTEQKRNEYYVINYIEPFDPTSSAFGLDVTSNTERYNAIITSAKNATPVATSRTQLLGNSSSNYGFVIYVPIYKSGMPLDTVDNRMNALQGVLSGIFSVNSLFDGIFPDKTVYSGLDLKIYDSTNTSTQNLLYEIPPKDKLRNNNLSSNLTVNVAGRDWSINLVSSDRYGKSDVENLFPLFIFTLGIVLSVIIYLLLRSSALSNIKAINLADNITFKLRESKQLLNNVISGVSLILFSIDKDGLFTLSEGKGLSKLGVKPGELVGKSSFEIYKDFPDVIDCLKRVLAGEEFTEITHINDYIFETSFSPLFIDSKVVGAIGVSSDVTERVKYDDELKKQKDELERLNNLMVNRELKMIELKKEIEDLKK